MNCNLVSEKRPLIDRTEVNVNDIDTMWPGFCKIYLKNSQEYSSIEHAS